MDAQIIKALESLKTYLSRDINAAFCDATWGRAGAEAWVDLAATVRSHGHASMVAADKDLNVEGWTALIDETIARLAPVAV
jgi:hypothetical protein